MNEFWSWGEYVSWNDCIKANEACNLRMCPETMNCCVSNCIGVPTIKGVIVGMSITIIVMFFIWIFNVVMNCNKLAGELGGNGK